MLSASPLAGLRTILRFTLTLLLVNELPLTPGYAHITSTSCFHYKLGLDYAVTATLTPATATPFA